MLINSLFKQIQSQEGLE